MRQMRLVTAIAVLTMVLAVSSGAFAVTLTVGTGSAPYTDPIDLNITVDNPETIAGAAFTITYDTSAIFIDDVNSTFFDIFKKQWIGTPAEGKGPDSVTVDVTFYDQPLATHLISGTGLAVAAARCSPANASNKTLFTLTFKLNQGANPGTYPITVIPTVLTNTAAGYPLEGASIPMLVGSDLSKPVTDQNAFPIKLDPPNAIGSVVSGNITFTVPLVDTDKDEISDPWEIANFTNLTTANATSDFDKDGFSDKKEAEKGTNPKVQNAPGGDGYNPDTDSRVPPCAVVAGTQYNMVVFGTAHDDENLATTGDWICAYGPGGDADCRAAGQVTNNGFYYLTVLGNTNGDKITYQLTRNNVMSKLDALILDALETETTTFAADETDENKELHFVSERTQTVELEQGWNWVSFNVLPADTPFEIFFGAASGNIEQVKTQTKSATNAPGLGWIGDDLTLMSRIAEGVMYKIKSKTKFVLEIKGPPVDPDLPLNLTQGWNWVAYLPNTPANLEDCLQSILDNVDQVKSQTQSKTKIGDSWMGDMQTMGPCKGYTMKLKANDTLVYPYYP